MVVGLAPWSRTVTVMVELLVPSAGTEVGDATTVEWVADTAWAAKATWAVWVTVTAVRHRRVGDRLDGRCRHGERGHPLGVGGGHLVMVELPLWSRLTGVPAATGAVRSCEFRPSKVTVTVAGLTPSATVEVGDAVTV